MTASAVPAALYRIFGEADLLLYIGISDDFGRRWKQHAKDRAWWGEKRRMTVEWLDSREEAEAAEKAAIKAEEPKYNFTRNPARRQSRKRQDISALTETGMPEHERRSQGAMSPEETMRMLPLAVLGGLSADDVLRLIGFKASGESGQESVSYFTFLTCCSQGLRTVRGMLADTRMAEQAKGTPEVIALCRKARRDIYAAYKDAGLSCPCCGGILPKGVICQECGNDGSSRPAGEQSYRLPVAVTAFSFGRMGMRRDVAAKQKDAA